MSSSTYQCSRCSKVKDRQFFTNAQLKKKGHRRCKACVARRRPLAKPRRPKHAPPPPTPKKHVPVEDWAGQIFVAYCSVADTFSSLKSVVFEAHQCHVVPIPLDTATKDLPFDEKMDNVLVGFGDVADPSSQVGIVYARRGREVTMFHPLTTVADVARSAKLLERFVPALRDLGQ